MTHARSVGFLSVAALLIASASLSSSAPQAKEPDAAGCKDHPLFTRMQNMHIVSCRMVEFERVVFKTGKGTEAPVEGKRFDIKYQTNAGNVAPSPLAIIRNHQQAIAAIGGTVQYEDQRYTVLKATKDGTEIWAQVDTAWMKGYLLTIVEKQPMVQEVGASAALFQSGLKVSGHVEVPNPILPSRTPGGASGPLTQMT